MESSNTSPGRKNDRKSSTTYDTLEEERICKAVSTLVDEFSFDIIDDGPDRSSNKMEIGDERLIETNSNSGLREDSMVLSTKEKSSNQETNLPCRNTEKEATMVTKEVSKDELKITPSMPKNCVEHTKSSSDRNVKRSYDSIMDEHIGDTSTEDSEDDVIFIENNNKEVLVVSSDDDEKGKPPAKRGKLCFRIKPLLGTITNNNLSEQLSSELELQHNETNVVKALGKTNSKEVNKSELLKSSQVNQPKGPELAIKTTTTGKSAENVPKIVSKNPIKREETTVPLKTKPLVPQKQNTNSSKADLPKNNTSVPSKNSTKASLKNSVQIPQNNKNLTASSKSSRADLSKATQNDLTETTKAKSSETPISSCANLREQLSTTLTKNGINSQSKNSATFPSVSQTASISQTSPSITSAVSTAAPVKNNLPALQKSTATSTKPPIAKSSTVEPKSTSVVLSRRKYKSQMQLEQESKWYERYSGYCKFLNDFSKNSSSKKLDVTEKKKILRYIKNFEIRNPDKIHELSPNRKDDTTKKKPESNSSTTTSCDITKEDKKETPAIDDKEKSSTTVIVTNSNAIEKTIPVLISSINKSPDVRKIPTKQPQPAVNSGISNIIPPLPQPQYNGPQSLNVNTYQIPYNHMQMPQAMMPLPTNAYNDYCIQQPTTNCFNMPQPYMGAINVNNPNAYPISQYSGWNPINLGNSIHQPSINLNQGQKPRQNPLPVPLPSPILLTDSSANASEGKLDTKITKDIEEEKPCHSATTTSRKIKVNIIDRKDPMGKLSPQLWPQIEEKLLEALVNEINNDAMSDIFTAYNGFKWDNGILGIECENRKAVKFLEDSLRNMGTIAQDITVVPKYYDLERTAIHVFVPPPLLNKDDILKLLIKQNKNFISDNWTCVEASVEGDNMKMHLEIAPASVYLIKKCENKIRFGMNKLDVKYPEVREGNK
ncbi:uncharacterized protein LOC142232222 isoform X2 [Haematobia irritans]